MKIGRRPLFFLGISLVFLIMLIPTPTQYRWVNLAMAGLALFWAVLLAAEETSAARAQARDDDDESRSDGGAR
jgi:hypothetical protein